MVFSTFAQDTITNVMSPIASYQYPDNFSSESLTNGGVISPFVSYQYLQDFSTAALTNGGIMSPIISYQYYEWPGNGILQLAGSLPVSYFYNAATAQANLSLSGKVMDALGQPLAGATISASVFQLLSASAQTASDGIYTMPALPAACYLFAATKSGYTPDQRVVAFNPATSVQNFQLNLLPSPLQTQIADSTPAFTADDLAGAKLRLYDGTSSRFIDETFGTQFRQNDNRAHPWLDTVRWTRPNGKRVASPDGPSVGRCRRSGRGQHRRVGLAVCGRKVLAAAVGEDILPRCCSGRSSISGARLRIRQPPPFYRPQLGNNGERGGCQFPDRQRGWDGGSRSDSLAREQHPSHHA